MFTKHRKSKKAISPILATLLLIVIAVAAIVVTYAWIMTYMTNAGQQAGIMLKRQNVRFYGVPDETAKNRIDFTIQNTGTGDAFVTGILFGNTSNNIIDMTGSSNISAGFPLDRKTAATITLNYSWEPGKTYWFQVNTEEGAQLKESVET